VKEVLEGISEESMKGRAVEKNKKEKVVVVVTVVGGVVVGAVVVVVREVVGVVAFAGTIFCDW
jgi:predicted PP-loop superfamily ATPase